MSLSPTAYRLKSLLAVLLIIQCILSAGIRLDAIDVHPEFSGKKILKIDFEGLRNTDPDDLLVVLEKSDVKEKSLYSDKNLNNATRALFKGGFLSNLKIKAFRFEDGVKLIFICTERPKIDSIDFHGTDEIYDTELREMIPLKEGDILRERLVKRSKQAILDKYQEEGLFLAMVKVNREYDEEENTVDLTFKIDEGEIIKVLKIDISGAKELDPEDLKGKMEIEEDGWFSDGSFNKTIYEKDRGLILNYMKSEGYKDARIVSVIKDEINYIWKDRVNEERAIHIKIEVEEGRKYYFNKYSIQGNKIFTKDFLFDMFTLSTPGEILDYEKYQMDRQSISMVYAGKGHIFARVIPTETYNDKDVTIGSQIYEKGTLISIDYKIIEGPVAKVEAIIIKGNKKTKGHVIRREILIKPGDVFDSFKIQRSRERVYNLGFFKEVNFDARPGSREPLMNLIIDVKEQPTGTISLGGGYGTQSGFSIFTEIAENNLRGNGQRLSGRFEYGPLRKQIQISFSDPWIIEDFPLSLYLSGYYILRTYDVTSVAPGTSVNARYDKSILGSSLGFGYRFWIFWGASIRFGLQQSTALSATSAAADEVFQQIDLGSQWKRWVTLSMYRDDRDDVFNTTNGLRTQVSMQFVGWGGDDHYKRLTPVIEYFLSPFHLPFLRRHKTVLQFRFSGDFTFPPIWQKSSQRSDNYQVELDDKLYVGGVETVRGWDFLDTNFTKYPKLASWADGGDQRILYGIEYRIPVEPTMLWIVGFLDAGGLWDSYTTSASSVRLGENLNRNTLDKDNFIYSWGVGLRVQIPFMPIRLYIAQRVVYEGRMANGAYSGFYGFKNLDNVNFVFGIGDFRY